MYICKSTPKWIERSKQIHAGLYDYAKSNPKSIHDKTPITCSTHGDFLTTFGNHITRKSGCPKCKYEKIARDNLSMTTEEFIKRCVEVHGDLYDYSEVYYAGRHKYITIKCKTCGPFLTRANNHLARRSHCPKCKSSKGERQIRHWLNINNVIYTEQHTFVGCRHKYVLRFDFYLPDYNTCVEFDGIQHTYNTFNQTDEAFELMKYCDEIKNNYCKCNNIRLIRIPYTKYEQIGNILSAIV